nr:putative 1-phosphatidylinositol 3-phosphate 5-kinase [Vanessa tameamea]
MEKYDTSQLTEFPRFESESNQSGVTTFLNKLWKFPIFTPSETADGQDNKTPSDDKHSEPGKVNDDKEYEDIKTETGNDVVEYEGRSLPNILKRISGLAALGSGGGTKYEDTELARYWMPDDISRECYECAARFSALRRRHHCRVCGQIFCSRCCSQRVPGQIFGCAGGLRVCTYCCKVVLTYLRENDMTGDISPDLRTLQESLQVKFPDSKAQHKNRDFIFAREQEPCEVRSSTRESVHDVFRQLYFAVPTQQHRFRLVRYNNVWCGCDILQWVIDNTSHKTRAQATVLCQSLLNNGYMERMTEPAQFADYGLYRPIQLAQESEANDPPPADAEDCSSRLVESVSSYCLDLNLGNSSARLIKATKTEQKSTPSSDDEQPMLDHTEAGDGGKAPCRAIAESGEEHLRLLMRQWLARDALPAAWLGALYPLCVQAADLTVPDMMSNDIDVRNYVQVKKVPGGNMTDSCVIPGVVMTKNVAHRGMPKQISNPTVLLLDCSIAYQRVEGKLTSLEPLLMQEHEYLSRCAARVANHPFIDRPITAPADDPALRASLAHFRATGCRVAADTHKPGCPRYNPSVVKKIEAVESSKPTEPEPLDPLSPENHQRLSLLLYSYSSKSPNVPDFCVNPWLMSYQTFLRTF